MGWGKLFTPGTLIALLVQLMRLVRLVRLERLMKMIGNTRLGRALRPRLKTPTVLQMEAVECGAASLAMILAYHKKFVAVEALRIACGVSRDGSKASNVVRAARQYGLQARGFKAEPGALRRLPMPLIAFWNFNHFLVVEGVGRGKVYLNDPACGRRVVSDEEFDRSFTGVVLAFDKGPGFTPGGRSQNVWHSLQRRLVGAKSALLYLLLLGVCLVIPGLVIPVFARIFIDSVLVANLQSWVGPLIVGMLCTAVLQTCLLGLQRQFLLKLETRIDLTNSARFLWHVLRLPVGFYHQRSVGDIGSRMSLNYQVAKTLAENLASGLLGLISAVFFALTMMFYDVTMSLVAIGVVLINFVVLRYVAAWRKPVIQQMVINRGKVEGVTMNGLMLMETLKASGAESDFFSRWAGNQARLTQSIQAMNRTTLSLDLLPKSLAALNTALILGLGGYRVMSGEMTIGMLVAFQALVAGFVGPVNVMVGLGNKIQEFHSDMGRLDDVMDSPCEPIPDEAEEVEEGEEAEQAGEAGEVDALVTVGGRNPVAAKLSGALELRNVTFGYSPLEPPLLDDFSLTLQPGQRIALVGPSGCGKSTIAKLVTGLYQPWQGQILFDGQARDKLPRRQLLNSIASVDQDISLFSGTIRDNLTMWDETIAESVMINAARDACIHDVIAARPAAYLGQVFEGGSNFSGGQRQRLEIARALTSNPRLLVLDEATSALDAVSEKLIDGNLRRRGCSCLIVAHRLSAIRDCDEIILLEKGKVLERGSHQALMELNAHYARLIANE